MILSTLFFLKAAVAIQGVLCSYNFWNICSSSVKYTIGILLEIVLNLIFNQLDCFGLCGHFKNLNTFIHENDMCFHFYFLQCPSSDSYYFPSTTLKKIFIVIQLQLSAFSPHPSTLPQPNPPPSPLPPRP